MRCCGLVLLATTGIHTHTHTQQGHLNIEYASCVHVLDCGNHRHMQENGDWRLKTMAPRGNTPTNLKTTHLQMQGVVSVPCMDEDCGNRAGAGAHVVGYYTYPNISHVSPRMGTCDAHARTVGVGDMEKATRQKAPGPSWCRPLSRGAGVGVFGPR